MSLKQELKENIQREHEKKGGNKKEEEQKKGLGRGKERKKMNYNNNISEIREVKFQNDEGVWVWKTGVRTNPIFESSSVIIYQGTLY